MTTTGLDLLLVNAPTARGVYGPLAKFAAVEPPVWAGLIATYCRHRGFTVQILDAEAEGLNAEDTAIEILSRCPTLAAFSIYGHQPSASTQCLPGASAVAKLIRWNEVGIKTLALGTHPSALPVRTVQEEPFHFVCQGEGPKQVLGVLRRLGGAVEEIPGLWWNLLNRPTTHSQQPQNTLNLDEMLPRQALDLLDLNLYRPLFWHRWTGGGEGRYASVQTSLGCPFSCLFCCINAPFGSRGIRYWSPANVVSQIRTLVNTYGVTNIKIPDEMFFLNRQHVREICEGLITLGLGDYLNMWAYARIDTVKDEALLALARKAGFRWLGIGIESGSKHVRDGVEKGFDTEHIFDAIARVHAAGLYVGANYIFGLPDDTEETMQDTLGLALALNTAHANFYCAMAYPGSPLHAEAVAKGWRLPEDAGGPGWIGYSQHSYESLPLRTETLTSEQVLDFRDNAWLQYHTRPSYELLLFKEFGPRARAQMQEITALGLPPRKHRGELK